MKIKMKRILGILLSLVMVLGLMPGMSLTAFAYEGDPYASLVNTTTPVTFNGKSWYIIADISTAVDAGTVTLLAADGSFGNSTFGLNNVYSTSTVKGYLDKVIEGTAGEGKPDFSGVATAIKDTDNGKLYLLDRTEAGNVSSNVRKYNSDWWLRSPGRKDILAAFVAGESGDVNGDGVKFYNALGVRPALQLNLSSVIFSSDTNTFSLKTAKEPAVVTTTPTAKTLTYNGSAQELVTAGEASGGTMQYALGTDATTAPIDGWSTSIPTATDAGTYYVWYKAAGDENHSDTTPACVIAKIDKGNPSANILEKETIKYSGEPQELVTPGTVENGIMMYALGSDDKTAPAKEKFSTSIPTGTSVGTYYVWYYAKGDAGYEDTTPVCVVVTIYELRADAEIDKSKLPDGKNTSVAGDIPIPEGLLSEAQKANNGNEKVELKLVVAPKGEEKAAESETLQKDAQMSNSVKSQYKDENSVSVEVLEIDIEKYINYAKADNVIETSKVLEIAIPYNFEGKYDPSVVRRHGDGVHVFTALSERPTGEPKDGTFFADRDNHILYIYANLFSTYVVAYSTVEGNARVVSAGSSSSQVDYPKTIPVYRLYNKYKGAHLLTTNNEERDILLGEKAAEGWIDEGIAFNVAVNSNAPVYRVFDLKNGIHFYTTDAATRDTYVANGCRDEGIAWYAALKPGRTVYKVSNPSNGRILYTISKPEADALTNSGYTCQEAEFVVY